MITRIKILIFVCISAAAGCGQKPSGPPASISLPSHTLIFGGDIFLGGAFSQAVYDPASQTQIFGDLSPMLQEADISFANAEGVISGGGLFAYKEDSAPLYYRAHPNTVSALQQAGIDVVTVGNNHSGDYGTEAFVEMLDRLSHAGIDYTGGGYTLEDARSPAIRAAGDTRLAIVGADMTFTKSFAAKWNTPGNLFFALAHIGKDQDRTVDLLEKILIKTRAAADVVLFSPHWGNNWHTAPMPALQQLAERLIGIGYDGILGHSAHLFHGVALINGKPVIYDAGNLVLNYDPRPGDHGEHRSVLYEIRFNKAGITQLIAHPLSLERNKTRLAKGTAAQEILETLSKRSSIFGTEMVVDDGLGVISCTPKNILGPTSSAALKKKWSGPIREAPSHLLLDKLPGTARPSDVLFTNGVRLAGYRMLTETLPFAKAAQVIETFWKTEGRSTADVLIHMEVSGQDPSSGKPLTLFAGHQPGDWMLPLSQWPKGKIIRDITYFRVALNPKASVRFYTGLWDGRKLIPVVSSSDPAILVEDNRILLGTSVFAADSPSVFDLFDRLRQSLR